MIAKTLAFALILLPPLWASDLVVTVSGVTSGKGEIGCALFRKAAGFPMDGSKAMRVWIPAKPGNVECKFENLSAGEYALAVSHDLNGNRKTDTNFVGMPKEDWGVSNNVRPRMRAPRFEEARFAVKEGEAVRLEVKVGR
ncbi:MAG: DUF2141 domain-containing protein [Bryobacteraceae bacterium]|nr:DUF2141 domain-containing protein [Bryobacteraceae bacterium]